MPAVYAGAVVRERLETARRRAAVAKEEEEEEEKEEEEEMMQAPLITAVALVIASMVGA